MIFFFLCLEIASKLENGYYYGFVFYFFIDNSKYINKNIYSVYNNNIFSWASYKLTLNFGLKGYIDFGTYFEEKLEDSWGAEHLASLVAERLEEILRLETSKEVINLNKKILLQIVRGETEKEVNKKISKIYLDYTKSL